MSFPIPLRWFSLLLAGVQVACEAPGPTAVPASADGSGPALRIHGPSLPISPPLFVVDGVRVDAGDDDLRDFRPEDVERIVVLRGARARARFGPDGVHGVVLIYRKTNEAREGPPEPDTPLREAVSDDRRR